MVFKHLFTTCFLRSHILGYGGTILTRRTADEGSRYSLGALFLVVLMVVSLILGWYGLYVEKAQYQTITTPTNTTVWKSTNTTSTTIVKTHTSQPTNTTAATT